MWLAVNENKDEVIFDIKPKRNIMAGIWRSDWEILNITINRYMVVPKGTIKKLIGKTLTWKDDVIEYK